MLRHHHFRESYKARVQSRALAVGKNERSHEIHKSKSKILFRFEGSFCNLKADLGELFISPLESVGQIPESGFSDCHSTFIVYLVFRVGRKSKNR